MGKQSSKKVEQDILIVFNKEICENTKIWSFKMEIMFEDLTPEAQKRLLREACVLRPEDMDWDELPVAIVEFSDAEHEFKDNDFDDDDLHEDIYDDQYYE